MMRNVPAMLLGSVAGVAVSIFSGVLLASYVTAGMLPSYSAAPMLTRSEARIVPPSLDEYPPASWAGPTEPAPAD